MAAHLSQMEAEKWLGEGCSRSGSGLMRNQCIEIGVENAMASLTIERRVLGKEVTLYNVAGNYRPRKLPRTWIVVVGAHYDHLGGVEGPTDQIYNGADDNASGTAALIELAEAYQQVANRQREMIFVAFSAEELGLLGSRAFVEQIDVDRVEMMLNFDMIGRNSDQPISLIGDGFATEVSTLIRDANQKVALEVKLAGDDYFGASDHDSFYRKDRPFLFFFTGTHEDYHQVTDHVDKLDYARMEKISRLGFAMLEPIVSGERTPIFIQQISWLGIKLVAEEGNIISQVVPGSRAEEAGLVAGDELLAVGENRSVSELPAALKELSTGESVVLTVTGTAGERSIAVTRAKSGYVGIDPGGLTDVLRHDLPFIPSEVVVVQMVVDDGPAAQAGLQKGDIILQIDGTSVLPRSLGTVLQRVGAGEEVTLLILRDGERTTVDMVLGERPER